jgi:hypothetical protein
MAAPKKYEKNGCNVPLKTPRFKRQRSTIIYQAVNELLSEGDSDFIPMWDETDHFHFCCANCKHAADVLQVDFDPRYAENGKLYALFIWLGCEKCGSTGFRKIYLKPSSHLGQEAFTSEQVLVFGKEKHAFAEKKYNIVQS